MSFTNLTNLSNLTMAHFQRSTTSKRSNSDATLNISWPLESGRESPELSAKHTPSSSRKSSSPDQNSCLVASSWYNDDMDSPPLSRRSTISEGAGSVCSDCNAGCIEESMMSPDKLPSQETLDLAGEVEIFDDNGDARPFKSLYTGSDAIGEQQLIIFVRHFFCNACQTYLKALSKTISMKTYFSLPTPTSITIIGFGDPELIPTYRSYTGTKFPIFTDPSRKLHRLLGMSWSLNMGRRPEYWEGTEDGVTKNIIKQIRNLPENMKDKRYKGGSLWWVGGEFLIKDGQVVWCHRMRNYRDHAEVEVLKELLGVPRS